MRSARAHASGGTQGPPFRELGLGQDGDVPDSYHETAEAFERLYQMLEAGCSSLLAKLERASWSGKTSSVR